MRTLVSSFGPGEVLMHMYVVFAWAYAHFRVRHLTVCELRSL